MTTIVGLEARDIRFPTSRWLDGSDAMHPDPDYSAAYVVLRTDDPARPRGPRPDVHDRPRHRGLRRRDRTRSSPSSSGARSRSITRDMRGFWRSLVIRHPAALARPREGRDPPGDRGGRQRRLGPVGEARGEAALEAARRTCRRRSSSGASTSATSTTRSTPEEAVDLLRARAPGRDEREREIALSRVSRRTRRRPAGSATTDEKVEQLVARGASPTGFTHVKMKVGGDLESDVRRAGIVRDAIGAGRHADDGRQPGVGRRRGDRVDAARSRRVDPWWIEEPTSPDDVLGHARIRRAIAPIAGRDRRARPEPRRLQAAVPGRRDRRLPARRVPARRRERGDRGAAAGGEVRRSRSARMRAASASASTSSTSRSFDYVARERIARRPRRRVGRPPPRALRRIRRSSPTGATSLPRRPATASRCCPASLAEYAFPHGPVWSPASRRVVGWRMTAMTADSIRPRSGGRTVRRRSLPPAAGGAAARCAPGRR